MRVAINIEQLFYRAPGGTGRYSARLASTLAQFSSVALTLFSAWHSRRDVDAVYERYGLDPGLFDTNVMLPLPRQVLFEVWHRTRLAGPGFAPIREADVVHVPFPAVPPVAQPLVVSVFDAGPAVFPDAYPARGRKFHERAFRLIGREAGAVLTATQAAADEITAFSPIPAHLLRVIPLGVDHRRPGTAQVELALARYGLSGTPYVLWVGSLEPRKGVGTLVKAFVKLHKSHAFPHRLVLAGPTGWLHEGLVSSSDRAFLGDRLKELGPLTEPDLRALYAGASVFAFPSWHEGFGLPVLEAMAQGAPVICSDIAALVEVSGGAAHLVPPGEVDLWAAAIQQVAGDESLRRSLVTAGIRRASGFTWEETGRRVHTVYEELALGH